jgi:uncharacterized membrane protein
MIKRNLLIASISFLLGACASGAPDRALAIEGANVCEDPRPQVCTMDYTPVCATLADGSVKTYSNGCGACADANVDFWVADACPATSTDPAASAQPTDRKTYSYLCEGEDKSIVVTIDGDRGHLFSYPLSQAITRKSDSGEFSGSDVYYKPDNPPDLAPGQTAEITIKGARYENCKNNPRTAVWEAAKLRGVDYRALGQEPGWQLEISSRGFLLVTGYGENRVEFPYAEPQVNQAERSTRYESQLDGDNIHITIRGEECSDSMSGETFNSKVEVSWQGETLRGCGRALH